MSAEPTLGLAVLLALAAGLAIPAGGVLATRDRLFPSWLETELKHAIIAFGGGVLLSAVCLVLIPEGERYLGTAGILAAFLGGGLVFCLLDAWIKTRLGSGSQLIAMLLDFIPEALALGAAFGLRSDAGILLALFIAIQNLPEGFNAFREIRDGSGTRVARLLGIFVAMALLGPLAAWIGYSVLADYTSLLGIVMIAASGGIVYLTFQDIAPQSVMDRHYLPPLGAVIGFSLGMLGHALAG